MEKVSHHSVMKGQMETSNLLLLREPLLVEENFVCMRVREIVIAEYKRLIVIDEIQP